MNPQRPPSEEEELAHYDDAIIGKAFRWSAVAFILLALAGAGIFFVLKRKPAPPPAKVTKLAAPVRQEFSTAQDMPTVKFTDITEEAGITFVHNSGALGDKLLPETMGSGVAFLDFDGDGDQ